MKNKDKYKDKILEVALKHYTVALTGDGEVLSCVNICCDKCKFSDEDSGSFDCDKHFMKWLEEEYQEPEPKLTIKERHFLEAINDEFYIARDKTGYLCGYCQPPYIDDGAWNIDGDYICLDDDLFSFITWESRKAWSYAELLYLEVEE